MNRFALSVLQLSAFNYRRFPLVAALLKAYYDGSGKYRDPNAGYLTLAGYVGTWPAWEELERRWERLLERWSLPYVHMSALRGLPGWDEKKVSNLVVDILNSCIGPVGRVTHEGSFTGAVCTVNLTDYRRASEEHPRMHEYKPAEAMCVDNVVTVALRALPQAENGILGKVGAVELYFDRGEEFLHEINKIWLHPKRPQLHDLIAHIAPAEMPKVYGLQAADFLAWHTNRGATKDDAFAGFAPHFTCPTVRVDLDYDRIIEIWSRYVEKKPDQDPARRGMEPLYVSDGRAVEGSAAAQDGGEAKGAQAA